jgi:predicted Ser/Thr protein kinase
MRGAFPTGTEPGAKAQPARWTPPLPDQLKPHFPQLEIIELVGAGGMGAVYKAIQPKLDRRVALKILPLETAQDPAFAERFNREAKALARLNHPNIVAVYDFGQSGDYYYFVMEFVEGTNLRHLIENKSLTPRQALELVTQICAALQFAHDEKIVHRDIKPENILVSAKGQVKIADFGLAKLMGPTPDFSLTASHMMMGTVNYMAPEQRENSRDVDHRADIYSLGVVIYEMLTGQVPMGRFDPPSKKVQVDVRLDEVVLHALEREPERRYQQVSEVRSGVETITSTMPREAAKPNPTPTAPAQPTTQFLPTKTKSLGWWPTFALTMAFVVMLHYLHMTVFVSLGCGILGALAWGIITREQRAALRRQEGRRYVFNKIPLLIIAAGGLAFCAILADIFISWRHQLASARTNNHDGLGIFLLLALLFGWVVYEVTKFWPSIAPAKRSPKTSIAWTLLWAVIATAFIIAFLAAARGQTKQALFFFFSCGMIIGAGLQLYSREQIRAARDAGLWPQGGEVPTLDHVKRLAQAGRPILAIRLYRQIHRVSLADAKAIVEKMRAS